MHASYDENIMSEKAEVLEKGTEIEDANSMNLMDDGEEECWLGKDDCGGERRRENRDGR